MVEALVARGHVTGRFGQPGVHHAGQPFLRGPVVCGHVGKEHHSVRCQPGQEETGDVRVGVLMLELVFGDEFTDGLEREDKVER